MDDRHGTDDDRPLGAALVPFDFEWRRPTPQQDEATDRGVLLNNGGTTITQR